MKKKLCALLVVILPATLLAPTALAAEPRWTNVILINPSISANGSYASTVQCVSGTSKIECTLVLYQKGLFGTYSEVSRTSNVHYGDTYEFSGHYNIQSGKTYKLTTTVIATCNGVSEEVSTSFEKDF